MLNFIGKKALSYRDHFFPLATLAVVMSFATIFVACGGGSTTFSLLPSTQSFQQATATVNNKLDILWVVDNSSSMTPLQQTLLSNFSSFMTTFQTKGFDYRIAVTTTDAYDSEAAFHNAPTMAQFQDGGNGTTSGVYVITPQTVNPINTFLINANQGQNGSGDERAFTSILDAMNSSLNTGFLRSDSFFAVIILSDEDDFSDPKRPEYSWLNGGLADHDYSNPTLMAESSFISQLDTLTNSQPTNRRYNISAITVLDSTCQESHAASSPATIIGQRYIDVAGQTNGITGSICDSDYSSSLNFIQQQIVALSTQFLLSTTPNESTIVVTINGAVVPQSATNGWVYNATNNSIQFFGTAVPPQGASVAINFDPTHLQ